MAAIFNLCNCVNSKWPNNVVKAGVYGVQKSVWNMEIYTYTSIIYFPAKRRKFVLKDGDGRHPWLNKIFCKMAEILDLCMNNK